MGFQICRDDGTGYEVCTCPDGGVPEAGGDVDADTGVFDAGDASNEVSDAESEACLPEVAGAQPIQVGRNRTSQIVIHGSCLPTTADVVIENCANMDIVHVSTTELEIVCDFGPDMGTMIGTVLDQPGGAEIGTFALDVTYGALGQSCDAPLECSSGALSCCDRIDLPAGSYLRGRGVTGADACPTGFSCSANEIPEHSATVSAFALDRFEVTVGRFRTFVNAFDGVPPRQGDGANDQVSGSGWKSEWNQEFPKTKADLLTQIDCLGGTWTEAPQGVENFPMTCLNFYVAFAFCIWDGGRVPTENEWEYAAAGGDENRLFPWGGETDPSGRINDCLGGCPPLDPVGTFPNGAARWGHLDMANSVAEHVLDTWVDSDYDAYANGGCNDCASTPPEGQRIGRGGAYADTLSLMSGKRVASRRTNYASVQLGARCAYNQ